MRYKVKVFLLANNIYRKKDYKYCLDMWLNLWNIQQCTELSLLHSVSLIQIHIKFYTFYYGNFKCTITTTIPIEWFSLFPLFFLLISRHFFFTLYFTIECTMYIFYVDVNAKPSSCFFPPLRKGNKEREKENDTPEIYVYLRCKLSVQLNIYFTLQFSSSFFLPVNFETFHSIFI